MGKIPLILVMASAAAMADAQTPRLTTPQVNSAEGAALVTLVRSAMHAWLTERTGADRQVLPGELARLENRPYSVAVRLRRDGRLVASAIQAGNSLPRNVIQAALKAMRDPALGDVVTQGVLEGLVVKVEVLGPPALVGQETPEEIRAGESGRLQAELIKIVQPGLVALRAERGERVAHVLPSTAYVANLDRQEVRRQCLSELGLTREGANLPIQWSAFLSNHYVSYPGGRVVELRRGKLPVPHEAVDRMLLARSADQAGAYLLASADADGRLMHAQKPSLVDHLYACWALARLARTRQDTTLQAALDKPLALATATVRRTADAAYVQSERPQDQLAATALLALTLEQRPGKAQQELRGRLLAAIRSVTNVKGQVPGNVEGTSTAPADPTAVCLARLALISGGAGDRPVRLPTWSRAGMKLTPAETLWALRVRLPLKIGDKAQGVATGEAAAGDAEETALTPGRLDQVLTALDLAFAGPAAPDDKRGGLAPAGQAGTTELTSLACAVLRQMAAEMAIEGGTSEKPDRLRLDAQRFCRRMIYGPLEAFFAEHPDRWEGAVRVSPEGSAISLHAAAAAIHALLD